MSVEYFNKIQKLNVQNQTYLKYIYDNFFDMSKLASIDILNNKETNENLNSHISFFNENMIIIKKKIDISHALDEEIKEILCNLCEHEFEVDNIEISPENTREIIYCAKCEIDYNYWLHKKGYENK